MAQQGQAARVRQIRTRARNALLKVKIFLAKWEDLAKEGRGLLEAACNTITRATNWPLICGHSLKGCQNLQPSGIRALRRRYIVAKNDLSACMIGLRTAVLDARNTVFTQVDIDISEPLFSCVDGQQFFSMLQRIVEKHEQQLEVGPADLRISPAAWHLKLVKHLFRNDVMGTGVCKHHPGAPYSRFFSEPGISCHKVMESGSGTCMGILCFCELTQWGKRGMSVPSHTPPDTFVALQVMITTWLLQTKIDKDSVDSVMSLLNSDVRTI